MDRLSLDEEHYNRQEEWRRQLPESLGEGLRQGLSRLGISLLGKGLPEPTLDEEGGCETYILSADKAEARGSWRQGAAVEAPWHWASIPEPLRSSERKAHLHKRPRSALPCFW